MKNAKLSTKKTAAQVLQEFAKSKGIEIKLSITKTVEINGVPTLIISPDILVSYKDGSNS